MNHHLKRLIGTSATVLICLGALAPLFAAPDLDVAYISRTPRYEKYNPTYKDNIDPADPGKNKPYLLGDEATKKHWPSKGEMVTFTAVIKNPGTSPTGEFDYKWFFDGKEVASGKLDSIAPNNQAETSYKWKWDSEKNDHIIKFVADPDNKIKEEIEGNNSVENYTNALCYRFHCWQKMYDWFKTEARKQNPDLATFDDWCQNQMRLMNQVFANSTSQFAPKGILEHVRCDEIVVEPDTTPDPDPGACHAPADLDWDGRWGFNIDPYVDIFTKNPDFLKGIYTWGLHEHSHQMGMIDEYQMYIEKDAQNKIKPHLGHVLSRTGCVMATSGSTHYCDFTANAFNQNLHQRRGYFGEFLYDIPQICKIRLIDAYGEPISGASIKFYQDEAHEVKEPATFVGTTDANGVFTMPNRDCLGGVTTGTGHTLHDNPWGMVNVVGFNGDFFCEIDKGNQKDYQYFEIFPFNLAFADGHKDSWTYDLQTTIISSGRPTTNDLFGVKMVSKDLGFAVGAKGTILIWNGKKWSQMIFPVSANLRAVDATSDGKTACAVGDAGTAIICRNSMWAYVDVKTDQILTSCAMLDPQTIVVGSVGGTVYRTADGGANWTSIKAATTTIRSIKFIGNKGIMVCEGANTYYSTDGGQTWTAGSGDAGKANLTGCSMATETEAWACNNSGGIFWSKDGGKTWAPHSDLGWALPFLCIDMKAGGNGWCLGRYHEFYNTTVANRLVESKDWRFEPVMTYEDKDTYYGVSCISPTEAWAVGKGGLIVHMLPTKY